MCTTYALRVQNEKHAQCTTIQSLYNLNSLPTSWGYNHVISHTACPRFTHVVKLICRYLHRPLVGGGQNGLLPVKLLCWTPSGDLLRLPLTSIAPQWIHVYLLLPLWAPAGVRAFQLSVPKGWTRFKPQAFIRPVLIQDSVSTGQKYHII